MTTSQISLEQLAEKIGGKLWIKGDLKRIYLDRGWNTKKMSTKTYVYQTEEGEFKVSCHIDCPSQDYNWIKSQQQQVVDGVMEDIENALSETAYIMVDKDGKIVNSAGKEVALNYSENFLHEERAKKEIDNCAAYHHYITMPRTEFEAEVERLDAIERQKRAEEQKNNPAPVESKPELSPVSNTDAPEYGVGCTVKHAKFGYGTVVAESEAIVEIKFADSKKQLLKKFVKLEKVEA